MSFSEVANLYLLDLIAQLVKVSPSSGGLPGGAAAQKILNGAAFFGLLACVGAMLWGAAQWGFGSRSSNYSQADEGKSRMLKGLGGAFAIGASAAAVNFFFNAGTAVR